MLDELDELAFCYRNHIPVVRAIFVVLGIVFWVISARATPATIYAYPLPSIYTNSSNYTLSVNGTNIPVVSYISQYDYAEFSMSCGMASVQVTAPTQTGITSYHISPEKLGLTNATIFGNTLTFTFTNTGSQYLIISVNGLEPFVFGADPTETSVPSSSGTGIFNVTSSPYNADNTGTTVTSTAIQSAINAASAYGETNGQGIVYVPTGVYLCGNIILKNDMALYLQGGSVIRGATNTAYYTLTGAYGVGADGTEFLSTSSGMNMKIYGRGTVDANGFYMRMTNDFGLNLLTPNNCTNFIADGITFRDAGYWGVATYESSNVFFSNLKIFNNTTVAEDDGIDVQDSENVTVSNLVAVSGDDTLSTKSYTYPIKNVLFENCLLWSGAVGCKIGFSVGSPQTDITFSNIVVYNCMNGVGLNEWQSTALGGFDGSMVGNVTWDTIDIESNTLGSTQQQAWGMFTIQNVTNGMATNLIVRNINVRQSGLNGAIGGTYTNTIINGITFSNISMPGVSGYASNLFQMNIFNLQYYTNLTILPTQSPFPDVYLTNSDPLGVTSFNAAGNWSNGWPPSSSTNYLDAAFVMRTPTSGNPTFAGGSLTLYDGATLALKNDNDTTTVGTGFANGLYLDNSSIKNVDAAVNDTFAGYITLLPDGGVFNMSGGADATFTISAAIGGSGSFQAGTSGNAGTIQLSGINTYMGGTIFGTSFDGVVTLQLSGSGTLGSTNNSLTFNSPDDMLDLNGTSQDIGNLSGIAGTITNSAAGTSTLTIGSGDNGGGKFSGNIVSGRPIAVTKVGSGTITLTGINTYTGVTTISNGTLLLNGIQGTNRVSVNGGSLGGTGLIDGPVVVTNFGTLMAGDSAIGTLTISNNLTLASSATVFMKVSPATRMNDLICGLGKVIYSGTLVISNLSGTLTNGDSFKLFSAVTYAGNVTNIVPATPGAGLVWTNELQINGTLGVIAVLPVTPTNIIYSVSNGGLTLSWPSDQEGWQLQVQTNSLAVGLSTNWVNVPDSLTTNQVDVNIDPANGTVFYRLVYP